MTLQVQGLSKKFYDPSRGEFFAVDDVSFECNKGEIFGLLGPNGAGKTTTLRMIAGILKPSTGDIIVEEHNIRAEPEAARQSIGFLSADTGLYERLTPREILRYFGELFKYPAAELNARIEQVIALLDLRTYADTRCEKLSTGMKQKVSIARSIIHDPPVLTFDEPTSGLDVIAIRAMHEFLKTCRQQSKCILFSTHIMSEAEKLCDRIAILHRGRIFAIGTLEELRQQTGAHYLEDIFASVVKEELCEFL